MLYDNNNSNSNNNNNNNNSSLCDPINEITSNYAIGRTLGRGGFGKVKLARHKLTGHDVAIKIIDKRRLEPAYQRFLTGEVEALKVLRHPHVARVFHIVDSADHLYMVMEYVECGELFDYIVAKDYLHDGEARKYFWQVAHAIKYCHAMGFAHRDIKPVRFVVVV